MSRWRSRRSVAAVLLGVLAAVLLPALAIGHAELVASTPAANSAIKQAPTLVALTFTERVDLASASLQLLDETGQAVAGVGRPSIAGGDRRLSATLPIVPPGIYEVSYRVTSAVDGHVTVGVFAFRYDPTGTLPPPTVASSATSPSADPVTIAARWTVLVAILVLLGTALFWLVAARPALARAAGNGTGAENGTGAAAARELPAELIAAPWGVLSALAAAALAALVGFLELSASALGGGPSVGFALDPVAAFGWTSYAIAMRVAMLGAGVAVVIAIAGALLGRRVAPGARMAARDPALLGILAAAALVSLGGLSFGGHASANGGPVFAALDTLHLLGVAAWVGTLAGLALLAWRTRHLATRRSLMGDALARHSRIALVAAPVVAITGLANSPVVLGQVRPVVASDYGNLVIAKAVLFSVAVAIGSVNFFLVRRRSLRSVGVLVAGEAGVGLLAVAVAATMLSIQPGAGRVPVLSQATNQAAHVYLTAGSSQIHAAIDIPSPGDQLYEVAVADANGVPRTDVTHVVLDLHPPAGSGLVSRQVTLAPTIDPAVWAVRGAFLPVLGEWTIGVTVQRAGQRQDAISFPIQVQTPIPPQLVAPPDTGIGVPAPLAALWVLPDGAAGWALAAVPLAAAAVLWVVDARRRRRGLAPTRVLPIARLGSVGLAVILVLGIGSRAVVDAANRPIATHRNPLPATPDSIARGRLIYLANCSSCHGTDGDGDGPQAAGILPAPGAIGSRIAALTDGELYDLVTSGRAGTQMPAFATSLSENDRWDLVNELHHRWPVAGSP